MSLQFVFCQFSKELARVTAICHSTAAAEINPIAAFLILCVCSNKEKEGRKWDQKMFWHRLACHSFD
jgi:hypothetical protein